MGRPRRYAPEERERAVRLVAEHAPRHDSQWAAIRSVAEKIGCSSETLRHWVRQVERQVGNVGLQLDPNLIIKGLDKVYDLAVEGVEDSPILKSAREIGDQYSASHGSLDQRARRLVRFEIGAGGTIRRFGGRAFTVAAGTRASTSSRPTRRPRWAATPCSASP